MCKVVGFSPVAAVEPLRSVKQVSDTPRTGGMVRRWVDRRQPLDAHIWPWPEYPWLRLEPSASLVQSLTL